MLATRAFVETFSPLKNRNLAIYLGGQAVSLIGTWMQATAQSWVVWELSHSARDLGLVAMLGTMPLLLFGLFGGAWADRMDRRKILLGTQVVAMLLAFTFALLVQTGRIQVCHIFILSLALGCVSALDVPAQSAFVGDLSGMAQVRRAAVLNAMGMQISRMVGPALAGWVMGTVGVAPAFWLNGASFLAVIGSLLAVRSRQVRRPAGERQGNDLLEGIRFMASQPRMQDLLAFTAFLPFFVFTAVQLLPAIVADRLHAGPETLGLISGVSAAGALTSSLVVLPLVQRFRRVGWLLAGAVLWIGAWFVLVAYSESLWIWVVGNFLGGLGGPVVMTTSAGLVQTLSPPDMRGRLLAAWIVIGFGVQPVAFLLVSYTGQLLGAPGAIMLNGAAMLVGAVALLLLRPGLRQWKLPPG